MKLKTLADTKVKGKTILYRSPYDIGVKKTPDGYQLIDDSRIRASLPTLRYLLEQECKIVILTYVKRPDGQVVEKWRTDPHAKCLAKLLGQPVKKVDDCVGSEVETAVQSLKPQQILMLENTRFHPEEMADDDEFAQELARNGELVVFDGFPQAHRVHASTTGILRHLPGYAGFYLAREVNALSRLLGKVDKPFTVVVGGAKVSDKLETVGNLSQRADQILLGGGVANLYWAAAGKQMGDSYLEDVSVDQARNKPKAPRVQIGNLPDKSVFAPLDLVIKDSGDSSRQSKIVKVQEEVSDLVPAGWAAVDIGPRSQELFSSIITKSATIFWNGPMGKIEDPRFQDGSLAILEAMRNPRGTTVIAGGDTVGLVNDHADQADFTHVSLAGGATMEFLAGKKLPVLEMLLKRAAP